MDFVTSCSDSDMLCLRFLLWVCAFEALSLTFVLVDSANTLLFFLLFSDGVMLPWPKEGCLERKGKPETTCIEWRLLGFACISLDLWDWSVAGSSEYCAELGETPEAAIFFWSFFCFTIRLMMDEISLLSFHLLLMPLLFKFILSHVCTVFNLFYLIPCHYVAWWAGIKLYELNLFLLSASIWHEHCLILSFDVIDYSFDWFCFTGHAQNKKEIKLAKHENWPRLKSKLIVHS